MENLRAELEALLDREPPLLEPLSAREVIVYGAGGCGRSVAAAAKARGLRVRAFLDARADALREVDGIECLSPTATAAREFAAAGLPVIVAVFNYAADLRPIFALLKQAGFQRVVSFYEAHELFELEPQFWLGRRPFYAEHAREILDGFDLLGDATSRQIYLDYIALRLRFDIELLTAPDQAHHYLPPDLPAPPSPLRFVDGGAFTGDTIQMFSDNGLSMEAVAAFEPDPENFAQLRQRVQKQQIPEVVLLPCGLGDETVVHAFAAGSGAASSLQTTGQTFIQVVALDDVLPTFAPNFIKLDIEGVEPAALAGARRNIERFAPRLAVCVYHAPEHLWTLPQLVHRLRPDYQLALRYHQFNGFDVVLYAFTG